MASKLSNYSGYIKSNGLFWTMMFFLRSLSIYLQRFSEGQILKHERKRFLMGEKSLTRYLNSVQMNYEKWNGVDWEAVGDEWTNDAEKLKGLNAEEWKKKLLSNYLDKYITEGDEVLEIGPGGGRWTEYLLEKVSKLHAVDVSDTALKTIDEKYSSSGKLDCHLIKPEDESLIPKEYLSDNTLDKVWSYDVFVHINPYDIDRYVLEFKRLLKPGGVGVIHHAGSYPNETYRRKWFRSNMNKSFMAHILNKHGFQVLEQNTSDAHFPGDVITVFKV